MEELQGGLAAIAPLAQVLADEAVIGILSRSKAWLIAVLATPSVINLTAACIAMTPLLAACYTLWPKGVKDLLAAGADPHGALAALKLGAIDWGGNPATAVKLRKEILDILLDHARRSSAWRPPIMEVLPLQA